MIFRILSSLNSWDKLKADGKESSALDSVNQFPHKGLTLDTSAFELFTTANLHYHLSW